jgi:hypothetical protein
LDSGLPGRSDDVLLLDLVPDTVVLGEGREGEEVAHEEDIVRLHDLYLKSAFSMHVTQSEEQLAIVQLI